MAGDVGGTITTRTRTIFILNTDLVSGMLGNENKDGFIIIEMEVGERKPVHERSM